MEAYRGKAIAGGIAAGRLFIYRKEKRRAERKAGAGPEKERERFLKAAAQAEQELKALYEKALTSAGEEAAAVFEAHSLMLSDPDFVREVERSVSRESVSAEYAVEEAGKAFAAMLAGMDYEYLKERAADVQDVAQRLIRILQGGDEDAKSPEQPVILAAEELSPSETVQMDQRLFLALVTERGTETSHTAILARSMGIPAVSGISPRPEWEGRMAAVDGEEGVLYIDPEEGLLSELENRKRERELLARSLEALKDQKTVTGSGRRILLYANVGGIRDVSAALAGGAEGVGLFRSEFLYLEKKSLPSEEELFLSYKAAAETMGEKRVIIRTLDIGADKQADYFDLPAEENPAMGLRGIRLCLKRPELLKTQLRAIFRAGVFGNLSVMYPMIASPSELRRAKALAEEAKEELKKEKIPFAEMEQGIMIETPAAALLSGELAREADFFSIGTNDLAQYTMAMDRQNGQLEEFFDPHHPALLRLIEETAKNGKRAGILVGICGELAADPSLTEEFIKMGIGELSVAPSQILPLRRRILELP